MVLGQVGQVAPPASAQKVGLFAHQRSIWPSCFDEPWTPFDISIVVG